LDSCWVAVGGQVLLASATPTLAVGLLFVPDKQVNLSFVAL
jgi:hypothetical protein